MKTVEMPKMGDTMEEGKILRWLKKEGDTVKKGESLAEVETDKVNIEIEAFSSGVLRKILVPEGESAPIGAEIALIGSADEPLPASAGAADAVVPARAASATTTAANRASSTSAPARSAVATQPAPPASTNGQGRIFISPIARRLAEAHQLDYAQIRGTGPNGRIIKMDIEAALAQQITAPAAPAPVPMPTAPASAAPATMESEEVIEIPLTSMRRTIAKRLSQSMQMAPHFYVTSVIDTGKLALLRQQINEYAANEPEPIKVSFNDLIIKAVARALVRMPQVNVSFAEDRIIQKKQVNVGMAVALETGLIVPVIKHADQRSVLDIAREARRLAEAARTGKLKPDDLSGGTFTVSNLGMFDVESFTAVINPPESAILAVGSITPTPVVEGGQVVVRDRMKVTLSSDHRALDGAIAARFLQEVKHQLEEPFGLLL
ncbi:MAG TPA: dihydrolipoamide acetyltransferase family protein [Ktedonobacteraceae bacterium]|nr:dihydrolipoamide acetyltransferase family protein [Ktedonobacteraceae bacterium]